MPQPPRIHIQRHARHRRLARHLERLLRHLDEPPRLARDLRKTATPHEDRLWHLPRSRRFLCYRFRRQVPIGSYIADFVCYGRRLIVEVDGSQHTDEAKYYKQRDAELTSRGFRVLRVWNSDIVDNEDGVMEAILTALRAD